MLDLFPFDKHRDAQESFMKVVGTALKHKKDVLAHVPTGVGKTVATLAPSLAFALENKKHVIFLTSKHTHHKIAVETLKIIKDKKNINFQVADFIGKRWMCPREDVGALNSKEFGEFCRYVVENKECPYYENYYSRSRIFTNKLLLDELNNNIFHVEELIDKCRNAHACSFEAAADLAKKSKVVILDYYHVLNPITRANFFKKIEKDVEDCIFIWDEAHNLAGRARELLSEYINTLSLDSAIKEAERFNQDLASVIVGLKESLLGMSEKLSLDKNEVLVNKTDLINLKDEIITEMFETAEKVIEEEKRSYLNSLAGFLMLWKQEDKRFTRILKRSFNRMGKPIISLYYNCLDPSIVLAPIIEQAHCNIFMSGTLHPLDMYEEIFGLKTPIKVEYENPFPSSNRLDLIVPNISTKYTSRNLEMYERIADNINELIKVIKGNKIFFFPSYELMDKVKDKIFGENLFIENQGTDKGSREALLRKFVELKDKSCSLLAVSSGSFGESVDLIGDHLVGVVIVGIPFGKVDLESNELIRYYEEKFKKGMEYGYIIPAFTSIMQNSGRCIRSENDKGVIVYLDERYLSPNYKKYFPSTVKFKVARDYKEVEKFFK
ncbi:ATP-dependent DNA helicase [Candidatus Woesearchaeota archaeon]|nr:ATP-dependent DNA helicase [Candidatus Woesearchaeota archaeon]